MPEITFGGGRIFYDVVGPRTPVEQPELAIVFVHGIGADRTIWKHWRDELAPTMPTLALDLPGHGRSFRPGADLDWNIDTLAEMVHAVAANAQARRLLLIGESIGGTICLAAAASQTDVAGVVTCSTAHVGGTLAHVRGWRKQIDELGLAGWSQVMLEKRFYPWQATGEQSEWFDQAQKSSDAETILRLADILVGLDFTAHLCDITCPVLLIHPDSSPFIPLSVAVQLKEGLPHGELMVIPGARHGIACSHATACANATQDFLARRGLVSRA